MNKKGQGVGFTVMVLIVGTILLFAFTPALNEVRIDTLANGGHDLFTTFILMLLIPIIWLLYFGISLILIKRAMFRLEV